MKSTTLIKWGGAVNIVGGVFVAAAYLLHPPSAPPETVASTLWQIVHVGFMISLLGGILGMVALFAHSLAGSNTWMGLVGFVASVISLTFVFGLDYAEVFIFPVLAVEFPEVVVKYGDGTTMPSVSFAFPATGALFMVGYLLMSAELYRQQSIARGACITMMVGVVAFAIGLSGLFPILVVQVGSVLFGAGLIWVGADLWSRHSSSAA